MRFDDLHGLLNGAGLDDVLVVGFIDPSERPRRFHVVYRTLFVECSGALLRCSVRDDSGRLLIGRVQSLSWEMDVDDDLEPACSSVRQAVLDDPDGVNRILALHLWDAREVNSVIECAAIRFDLANGQRVFFDPSYHFGIKLGGLDQQNTWMRNSPQNDYQHIELSLGGGRV